MATRTLVLHTGALGDFLMACPAIEALHREGAVELFGAPERHALAVTAGIADRAHPLDALRLHEIFAATANGCVPAIPPRLREVVAGFDRAIVWMRDPGGVLARALREAGIAKVLCAPGLPAATWEGHASAYYLSTIGRPPVDTYTLNFTPSPGLDAVLAPGSGAPRKNWPRENFVAVAEHLNGLGLRVTWLLGPAEEDFRVPEGHATLRCPPLPALAGQLAAARIFLGNDSGTTHLASLAGCPTVALFGPASVPNWSPIGAKTTVLWGKPWPEVKGIIPAITKFVNIK